MKVLIAGGSGFVGKYLARHFKQHYQAHLTLVSRKSDKCGLYDEVVTWEALKALREVSYDLVVNLTGYNISARRWSQKVKDLIVQSRVESTSNLIDFLCENRLYDTVMINASAVGFYPFSSQKQDEEQHLPSDYQSFSQQVVQAWEQSVERGRACGLNITIARFGVVIGHGGGMFDKVLLPTKLGGGAIVGDGKQLISWVSVCDLCRAIDFIYQQPQRHAVYNITAPEPVSQGDFTRKLAKQLKRPAFMRMPRFIVKAMFGQMGEELLLSSQSVYPKRLLEQGFTFEYDIDQAIEKSLAKDTNC